MLKESSLKLSISSILQQVDNAASLMGLSNSLTFELPRVSGIRCSNQTQEQNNQKPMQQKPKLNGCFQAEISKNLFLPKKPNIPTVT